MLRRYSFFFFLLLLRRFFFLFSSDVYVEASAEENRFPRYIERTKKKKKEICEPDDAEVAKSLFRYPSLNPLFVFDRCFVLLWSMPLRTQNRCPSISSLCCSFFVVFYSYAQNLFYNQIAWYSSKIYIFVSALKKRQLNEAAFHLPNIAINILSRTFKFLANACCLNVPVNKT